MKVILREEARTDVLQAFEWYEGKRAELGAEFRDALDVTIARVLRHPLAYASGERSLRRALVSRFPYAVYFRVYPEAVVIARVLILGRFCAPEVLEVADGLSVTRLLRGVAPLAAEGFPPLV